MHSGILKYVGMASWFITAVASIHIAMVQMGYNLISLDPMQSWYAPLCYVVGLAGLFSLVMLVMAVTGACKCAGSCSCAGNSCR